MARKFRWQSARTVMADELHKLKKGLLRSGAVRFVRSKAEAVAAAVGATDRKTK